MTPTERSLRFIENDMIAVSGVQVVERWNPFAKRRIDLFGFGDILYYGVGRVVIVQTTSYSGMSARIAKCKKLAAAWLWAGPWARVEIHGWKAPTKTIKYWRLCRVRLSWGSVFSNQGVGREQVVPYPQEVIPVSSKLFRAKKKKK